MTRTVLRRPLSHLSLYLPFLFPLPRSIPISPTTRNPQRNRRIYWSLGPGKVTSRRNAGPPTQTQFIAFARYSMVGADSASRTGTVTLATFRLACPAMAESISCSLEIQQRGVTIRRGSDGHGGSTFLFGLNAKKKKVWRRNARLKAGMIMRGKKDGGSLGRPAILDVAPEMMLQIIPWPSIVA